MGDFNRNFKRNRSDRGRDRPDRNQRGGFRGRDSGRPFDRNAGRGRSSDRNRGRDRYSERHEMHSVICDKCGNEAEVPFKPTKGKPIYCDDCFKDRNREAGSRSELNKLHNKETHDQINKKLDKILKILEKHVNKKSESPKETKKSKKNDLIIEESILKNSKRSITKKPILEEPVLKKETRAKKPKKVKKKNQ